MHSSMVRISPSSTELCGHLRSRLGSEVNPKVAQALRSSRALSLLNNTHGPEAYLPSKGKVFLIVKKVFVDWKRVFLIGNFLIGKKSFFDWHPRNFRPHSLEVCQIRSV